MGSLIENGHTYALSFESALDLAEKVKLSVRTEVEPSSVVSVCFTDENDAFAFTMAYGGRRLSTICEDDLVIVNVPIEDMEKAVEASELSCNNPWLATEWVRVRFSTEAERQTFEQALYPHQLTRETTANPVVD
jgi:hypothetical protein